MRSVRIQLLAGLVVASVACAGRSSMHPAPTPDRCASLDENTRQLNQLTTARQQAELRVQSAKVAYDSRGGDYTVPSYATEAVTLNGARQELAKTVKQIDTLRSERDRLPTPEACVGAGQG